MGLMDVILLVSSVALEKRFGTLPAHLSLALTLYIFAFMHTHSHSHRRCTSHVPFGCHSSTD